MTKNLSNFLEKTSLTNEIYFLITGEAKVKAEILKSNIFINKKARDFVFFKNLSINKIHFLNKEKTPC